MSTPEYTIVQYPYRNPHAKSDLRLTLIVVPNTSPEQVVANVMANAALPLEWLNRRPQTDKPAVMVAGGPSAADHIEDIRRMQQEGGVVFSMNGSSRWLRKSRHYS